MTLLASDIPALIGHTRRVFTLADDQLAVLTPGALAVTTLDGEPVEPEQRTITWDLEAAQKGGYEDFMSKEIDEQPKAVADTLLDRRGAGGELILDEMRLGADELRGIDKVFIVACGSSYHAALVAKYAIEHWVKVPVEVDIASEFRYRDPVLNERTLCVGVSQSGETLDTSEAMREAARLGAKVLVVSNVVDSSMARAADGVLYTRAGPEIGVASTKCHLAQIVALEVLGLYLAQVLGDAAGLVDQRGPRRHGGPARRWSTEALARVGDVDDVASKLTDARDFFFLGRHVGFPVALEGALKLKELAYLRAEGYPAGELKHGPIALIEPGTVVVGIATRNPLWEKMLSNVAEVRSRGATVVLLADDGDEESAAAADHVLWVPPTSPLLAPVVGRGPAATAGLPAGPPARARPGPAAQPGQDGDRRVSPASAVPGHRGRRRRCGRRRAFPPPARPPPRFAARCFTDGEQSDAGRSADAAQSLAARFAAKEAVMKALGTGIGGFALTDVEVRRTAGTRRHPQRALSWCCTAGGRAGRHPGRGALPPLALAHRRRRDRVRRRRARRTGLPVRAVLTRDEMRAADAAALAWSRTRRWCARAGTAVAHAALRMLGGAYGRRVVVVAGKGSNGADGRVAAAVLARRGARVAVLEAEALGARRCPARLRPRARRRLRHRLPGVLRRAARAGGCGGAGHRYPLGRRRRHGRGTGRRGARRPDRDVRRPQAGPAPGGRRAAERRGRGGRHRHRLPDPTGPPRRGRRRRASSRRGAARGTMDHAVGRGRRLGGHGGRGGALHAGGHGGRRRHDPARRAR